VFLAWVKVAINSPFPSMYLCKDEKLQGYHLYMKTEMNIKKR